MFRLSHYMKQLVAPTPVRQRKGPVRPVVIWNLTRRCNLKCRHCYAVAADHHFPGELTTQEAYAVLDDLAAFNIPALILSGGEPLSRADTLDIARRSKAHGLYTALSTNGTPISGAVADELARSASIMSASASMASAPPTTGSAVRTAHSMRPSPAFANARSATSRSVCVSP